MGRRPRGAPGAVADADAVDPRALLAALWRGRRTVLGAALLCAGLAFVLVSQVTPRYSALSQVLLDPRERRILTDEQVVSDLKLNDQVVASEMSILRSNVLIAAVIAQLDSTRPGLLDPLDSAAQAPSLPDRAKTAIKELLGADDQTPTDPEAQARYRVERLTWAIRRVVDIWRDGDSYVISIAAETEDPALSAALAGTIAETYIGEQLSGRRQSASQATRWIEQRIDDLRRQVEQAEDAVEDYRARSLVDNGSSMAIIQQRMVSLNEQLVQARVTRVAGEARITEMARLIDNGGFEALGNMLNSDTIEELNTRRIALLGEDAQWAQGFDETNPRRQRLRGELDEVNRALRFEFGRELDAQRNELEIARIGERTLRQSLDEVEQEFLSVSRANIGLRQLEREAGAARTAYEDLLSRFAETRTQENLQQADARIIERATIPGAPSAPRPKLMTLLGLLFGMTVGAALVLLRELTPTTYRNVADLEAETGRPVLSVVPARNWSSPVQAMRELALQPRGEIAEAMRGIRTALDLGDDGAAPQSLAFLSALPGEGKTTTTALLARMAEASDKLVCVVDCDLRQSSIQGQFQFPIGYDLPDLIRGKCDLLEAVFTETGLGFDLLAARNAETGAADMLSTGWLRRTLDELKDYYDLVLVNAPAMLPAAEAMVIARAVDRRVFVVQHDHTPRQAVARCLQRLSGNGLDLDGIVLTQVDPLTLRDTYLYDYGSPLQEAR